MPGHGGGSGAAFHYAHAGWSPGGIDAEFPRSRKPVTDNANGVSDLRICFRNLNRNRGLEAPLRRNGTICSASVYPAPSNIVLHTKQFGNYEIIRKLGRGMTDVYLGFDTLTNRHAVLKIVEESPDPLTQLIMQ